MQRNLSYVRKSDVGITLAKFCYVVNMRNININKIV